MDLQKRLDAAFEESSDLRASLDNERTLVKILQEKVEKSSRLYDEQRAQADRLDATVTELQHDCRDMERRIDKLVGFDKTISLLCTRALTPLYSLSVASSLSARIGFNKHN